MPVYLFSLYPSTDFDVANETLKLQMSIMNVKKALANLMNLFFMNISFKIHYYWLLDIIGCLPDNITSPVDLSILFHKKY